MDLSHIPHRPGVYLMRDALGKILYVGKARDLRKRVASYFRKEVSHPRTAVMLSLLRAIDYIPAASERESLLLEQRMIHKIKPLYNVMWRDDKSYPFVKLTWNEDYPRLVLTRRRLNDGGRYFGPYPNVSSIRKLLKALWRTRALALRPCRLEFKEEEIAAEGGLERSNPSLWRKVRSCIYLHTGACTAPCVGKISRADYAHLAEQTELFFRGRVRPLKEQWEREMKVASAQLDYERAANLRDRLRAVSQILEHVTVREVDESQIALETGSSRALTDLMEQLGAPTPPLRIEGFDISNFQGSEPVASLVAFENGKPRKSDYRKFKMRTARAPDDFAMIAEVVERRYRRVLREGGKFPDLILIDGGKGQLSAAVGSLERIKKEFPRSGRYFAASLAKREEEIFLPGRAEPIRLPKDSPALHLVQAVRDEAHRFAVSFHRLRRKKRMFEDQTGRTFKYRKGTTNSMTF